MFLPNWNSSLTISILSISIFERKKLPHYPEWSLKNKQTTKQNYEGANYPHFGLHSSWVSCVLQIVYYILGILSFWATFTFSLALWFCYPVYFLYNAKVPLLNACRKFQHNFNLTTREVEAGRFRWVEGEPDLWNEFQDSQSYYREKTKKG
jgi:hypothetical protein